MNPCLATRTGLAIPLPPWQVSGESTLKTGSNGLNGAENAPTGVISRRFSVTFRRNIISGLTLRLWLSPTTAERWKSQAKTRPMVGGTQKQPEGWHPCCQDFDSKDANSRPPKVGNLGNLARATRNSAGTIREITLSAPPTVSRRRHAHVRFAIAAAFVAVLAAPSLAQPPVAVRRRRHSRRPVHRPVRRLGGGRRRRRVALDRRRQDVGAAEDRHAGEPSRRSLPHAVHRLGRGPDRDANGGGSVGVMLRTTDGGMQVGRDGHERAAGAARGPVLRREERVRLRRRQSDAFPAGMFTTERRRANVEAGHRREAAVVPRGGLLPRHDDRAWSRAHGAGSGTVSPDGRYREADSTRSRVGRCTRLHHEHAAKGLPAALRGRRRRSGAQQHRRREVVGLREPRASAGGAGGLRLPVLSPRSARTSGSPASRAASCCTVPIAGKTWEVQKTELPVPVNGMYFLTDEIGWMVGELGCIFGTTDGGKTWKVQRTGGQRAAVLCLHASHRSTPLDVVSVLGHGEGYLCAAVGTDVGRPRDERPEARSTDAARLRYAMRLAGGATGDVGWAFPVAAHAAGLPPRELMASWDRAHGGKAAEQLLRQAVSRSECGSRK